MTKASRSIHSPGIEISLCYYSRFVDLNREAFADTRNGKFYWVFNSYSYFSMISTRAGFPGLKPS